MDFTTDWFSMKIPSWKLLFQKFKKNETPWNCLEIGSWEGRSAVFLLEELQDSHLTCVDTFEGSVEHSHEDTKSLFERFTNNTRQYSDRLTVYRGMSFDILKTLNEQYDFIYVDGSHEFVDVVYDIFLSWKLLKPGGLIVFDDVGVFDGVNKAISIFETVFKDEIQMRFNGYDQLMYLKS